MESLIEARRSCRLCMEKDAGLIRNGAEFKCDQPVVSFWSQWLGHARPIVLIVGQDFSNVSYFLKHRGQDDPKNKTNQNLHSLLTKAGIDAGPPPTQDHHSPVFLTNSILCLKTGSMDASIKDRWVRNCSDTQLTPLINFLSPKIIVGMGKHGWAAVRRALNVSEASPSVTKAAGRSWQVGTRTVFPVVHCGPKGLISRPEKLQITDWENIGRTYSTFLKQ